MHVNVSTANSKIIDNIQFLNQGKENKSKAHKIIYNIPRGKGKLEKHQGKHVLDESGTRVHSDLSEISSVYFISYTNKHSLYTVNLQSQSHSGLEPFMPSFVTENNKSTKEKKTI